MQTKFLIRTALCALTATSCLTLLLATQAFATPQVQQPSSLTTDSQIDTEVTPAGCTNSCSDKNLSGSNGCCEAICCPKKTTKEVKKHCWKVKPELVCIPGFRFECNWKKRCQSKCGCDDTCCSNGSCSDCGPPTCGRVRCINVLEKHEYTCDKCGYEWNVKYVRSGGCCKGKGSGCCPSCDCASVEAEEADVQLTATTTETTPIKEIAAKKPSLARQLMPWLK